MIYLLLFFIKRKMIIFHYDKMNSKEKIITILKIISILVIFCFCVLLFPQVQKLIIKIGEIILGRNLNHNHWMKIIQYYSLSIVLLFSSFLAFLYRKTFILSNVIFWVAICLILIFTYIYLCFCVFIKIPFNSDMASFVHEANDIFHGNIFLSDWVLTGISFITTDLLFHLIGVVGYGIHIYTYYVGITLMFVLLSFSSLLLFKWRDLKYNVINVLIWLSVGALPIGITPRVFQAHMVIWIYVFTICFFIEKIYQEEKLAKQSKRYLYVILITVFCALGIIGDGIILVGLLLPVFIVCFYLWLTDYGKSRFIIKLVVSLIIGTLSGFLLDKLYFIIGGADKNSYLLGKNFKNLNDIQDSFLLYIKGLFGLFDADFTGKGIFHLKTIFYGLRFFIVVFGLYLIVKTIIRFFNGKNYDITSVLLSIGFVILSISYIFTDISTNINTTRYYAYSPVLFSILISRFLSEQEIWSLTLFTRKIRVLYGVLIICVLLVIGIIGDSPKQKWTMTVADNPYIELGDFLRNNGLEKGYSGFWDASVTTVTTKNTLKIRAVLSDGKSVTPKYWFNKKSWYNEYANFVVISNGYNGIDEKNITTVLGEPYKYLYLTKFIIYVYDRDISKELTGLRKS